MNLKKNILKVFSANILSLISGVVIGFILPAVLTVEAFGEVKTFTFYLTYLGVLHLGFVDGMYIKYGGKELDKVSEGELKSQHKIFIIMQGIISIAFFIVGIIKKDFIIILLSASIIPVNTLQFHQLFYQAVGEFKEYSRSIYIYTSLTLTLNVVLAIVLRNKNYIFYCLAVFFANLITYMYLELKFLRKTKGIQPQNKSFFVDNIKVGFFVLIGNLSVIIFYGIDRWFVKLLFSSADFAYYSFAVSMLGIVNVLVSSISIAFYNYLSKGEDQEKLKKLKMYFLILGAFASFGYFALAAIVNLLLPKYIPSLGVIAVSFAAYPYMIIINALYVNLYKARKDQYKYVKVVFFMVFIAIIYNVIAVVIFKNIEAIAAATTLSFITWYLYSVKDFSYLRINLREVLYLSGTIVSFLLSSHYNNWFIGGTSYLMILIVLTLLVYRLEIIEIIKIPLKIKS